MGNSILVGIVCVQIATPTPSSPLGEAELYQRQANITVNRTDQPQGSPGSPSVLTSPANGEVLWGILRCWRSLWNSILEHNHFTVLNSYGIVINEVKVQIAG